jgi:hypothetical protein
VRREDARFVEQRAWIEHGEHVGAWPPDGTDHSWAGPCEEPRQLAAPTTVESLQQPPVPPGRQHDLVIGQVVRPPGPNNPHSQILVDHDHHDVNESVPVGLLPTQDWIGGADGVERGLELAGQVAVDHTPKELAVCVRQTGVASTPSPATPLTKFLTDAHATSLPGERSDLNLTEIPLISPRLGGRGEQDLNRLIDSPHGGQL